MCAWCVRGACASKYVCAHACVSVCEGVCARARAPARSPVDTDIHVRTRTSTHVDPHLIWVFKTSDIACRLLLSLGRVAHYQGWAARVKCPTRRSQPLSIDQFTPVEE